jgi:hypothetical protein
MSQRAKSSKSLQFKTILDNTFCFAQIAVLTRLKRLPVISREHFRKTRTNYF